MAWLIGIDEAGYGPNLGPFVMSSVACRVPDDATAVNLWHLLRKAVRRHGDASDERICIDDSKLVFSPGQGLLDIETSVLSVVASRCPPTLDSLLTQLCPNGFDELRREMWFDGETTLPAVTPLEHLVSTTVRLAAASVVAGIEWGPVRSSVVCPARFNQTLQRWGTKGAVLSDCLIEMLKGSLDLGEEAEPLHFCIDKHGGRNTYSAMLQDAFPDGCVMAHEEGMQRSSYRVMGLTRDICMTFQPRADASHLGVALASMVSKYLREVLMGNFNRYWQRHLPALKPTAGYPLDATRFFAQIRTLLPQVGLEVDQVWRRK